MHKWPFLICFCLGATLARAEDITQLDGIWMTDGYGTLAEIADGHVQLYQIAGDICLPEHDAPQPLATMLPGMTFDVATDGQSLTAHFPMDPYRIRATRIAALPDTCLRPPPDTPLGNFEAFAAFFAHNYAFFHLYDVDWAKRVNDTRQEVRPDMGDADLFALMSRMITPLRDGHVGMFAEIDGNDQWFAPHRGRTNTLIRAQAEAAGKDPFVTLETFRQDLWFNSIANGILGGEGHLAGNQRVQYGMTADTVGYLALATLGGFGPQDANPHEQLAATQAILEEVMWYFKTAGAKTLILDLSLNLGGNDFTAREVASRFAVGPTHGYTKFASDAETPNDAHVVVLPSTGKRFSGEVYVLTSNVTISAGEILTLTLRAMPQVRHVGERTRGAFSSVLAKTLPNGWQLLLSNETYLDADGTHWEGRGIKPHLEMLVFSDLAPIESHAQTVEALISALD